MCEILFPQSNQARIETVERGIPFDLPSLRDRFSQTLLKWFEALKVLRPVFDLFFSDFRTDIRLEPRFLAFPKWPRVFIVALSPANTCQPVNSIKLRRRWLRRYRRKSKTDFARMKSQIHFANDPSLRSRLMAILKQLSDAERGIICENAGEFIEAVVDTRNYLTHLDEKSGDCILRGVQLFQATSRLEILLFLLFFKYIGFGQIEVLESLKNPAVSISRRSRQRLRIILSPNSVLRMERTAAFLVRAAPSLDLAVCDHSDFGIDSLAIDSGAKGFEFRILIPNPPSPAARRDCHPKLSVER